MILDSLTIPDCYRPLIPKRPSGRRATSGDPTIAIVLNLALTYGKNPTMKKGRNKNRDWYHVIDSFLKVSIYLLA